MHLSISLCAICHEHFGEPATPGTTNNADIIPVDPPITRRKRPLAQTTVPAPAPRSRSEIVTLPCGHLFHHVCTLQWFSSTTGVKCCPICRRSCRAVKKLKPVFPNTERFDVGERGNPSAVEKELDETKRKLTDSEQKLTASEQENKQLKIALVKHEISAKRKKLEGGMSCRIM